MVPVRRAEGFEKGKASGAGGAVQPGGAAVRGIRPDEGAGDAPSVLLTQVFTAYLEAHAVLFKFGDVDVLIPCRFRPSVVIGRLPETEADGVPPRSTPCASSGQSNRRSHSSPIRDARIITDG